MEEQRELTVLVYLACDNALAPLVVSEIKAIKDAGFQENTTVLVHYDPMEKGAPTQLLDVNFRRKNKDQTHIGDGADPFVRNMIEDEVESLNPATPVPAFDSLKRFIKFALEKRTAKNYMLILLGHGMIVGNDTFLPDGDSGSAITLKQLKELCGLFTKGRNTSLRLLGLHSCSMSSIEVAYQLKGRADYMLATQGTMFVNGWPYRQLLKKTLNQVKRAKQQGGNAPVDYDELIGKLYFLCLFNFTDFMTAGYSCDIAVCRLHPENFERLKESLQKLVSALKDELFPQVSVIKDLILLAHWDAQSFWSENYTDLWDFCYCLAKRCDEARTGPLRVAKNKLLAISQLCREVQDVLAPANHKKKPKGIVRHADNFGTEYQYARGLSIYFPWHKPLDDQRATLNSEQDFNEAPQREATRKTILENYKKYDFTREFGDDSWLSFLLTYWDETKRAPRHVLGEAFLNIIRDDLDLSEHEAKEVYTKAEATFNSGILKRTPELKKTPDVGTDCTCPTIKNYPTRPFPPDSDRNVRQFSITPGALRAFLPLREGESVEPEDE